MLEKLLQKYSERIDEEGIRSILIEEIDEELMRQLREEIRSDIKGATTDKLRMMRLNIKTGMQDDSEDQVKRPGGHNGRKGKNR